MFTEKLRSLLKFGPNSTRYKDIFDMRYLSELVDKQKLMECFRIFIFDDDGMRENDLNDIVKRVEKTFSSSQYFRKLEMSRKNWLNMPVPTVIEDLIRFRREI